MKLTYKGKTYEIDNYYRSLTGGLIIFKNGKEVIAQIVIDNIKKITDLRSNTVWDFKEITDNPSGTSYKANTMEDMKNRKIKEIIVETQKLIQLDITFK